MVSMWQSNDKPFIEMLLHTPKWHGKALVQAASSAEHAYRVIKNVPYEYGIDRKKHTSVSQEAIEYAVNAWVDSGGENLIDIFDSLDSFDKKWIRYEIPNIMRTMFLNPLKHRGYPIPFAERNFESPKLWESLSRWFFPAPKAYNSFEALRNDIEGGKLARNLFHSMSWHCEILLEGIDAMYDKAILDNYGVKRDRRTR